MSFGVIEYDKEGKPICEICGKSFLRVMNHVRYKHDMTEREYKKQFGFDLIKGICSKDSSKLSRQRVYENYDLCINRNLMTRGEKTRFLKGDKGRTGDMVSEQTRLALIKRFKNLSNSKQNKDDSNN